VVGILTVQGEMGRGAGLHEYTHCRL